MQVVQVFDNMLNKQKAEVIVYTNLFQICDNLFNGSFPDEQKAVQEVVANVEMYSNLIKQVLKTQSWIHRTNLQHFTSYQLKTNCMNF